MPITTSDYNLCANDVNCENNVTIFFSCLESVRITINNYGLPHIMWYYQFLYCSYQGVAVSSLSINEFSELVINCRSA